MSPTERRVWALTAIRGADSILLRAGRERPHGFRSALQERRGGVEPEEHQIIWALDVVAAMKAIEHDGTRRALALVSATDGGEALFEMTEVARMIGINDRTLRKWMAKGLDQLGPRIRGASTTPNSDRHTGRLQAMN